MADERSVDRGEAEKREEQIKAFQAEGTEHADTHRFRDARERHFSGSGSELLRLRPRLPGEAWWGVRREPSDGRDLSYILQAVEKQQVFISKRRIDFRNQSTKWWNRGVPLGLCLALCEFSLPPLLQAIVQTMPRQVLPNAQEKATNE